MSFTLRAKRMLVTAATGALVLSLFPAATAFADTADVCENAPDAGFSDAGTTHADNIDCMSAYGIGQGYGDGTYGTFDPLTRGQAATLIYKFAQVATDGAIEDDIDETDPVPFTDMGTTHAAGISALYRLDLVAGTTTTTYSPNAAITRAQYATILYNAHVALGTDFEASYTTNFTDIEGSIHADAIAALEGEDVISGTTTTTYTPAGFITRGANASLLALSAGLLDEAGLWLADRLPAPTNQTFMVTPADAAVNTVSTAAGTTANQGSRTYSVPVSAGDVNIALFAAADVNVNASGVVTFDSATPLTAVAGANPGVSIEVVNGAAIGSAGTTNVTQVNDVSPAGGNVTFTVDSTLVTQVIPVVYSDTVDDAGNALSFTTAPTATTPQAPSEDFGIGGQKSWVPAEAALGTDDHVVETQNASLNYLVTTAATDVTLYYDSNDVYQFDGVGITMADFERISSAGAELTVAYNPSEAGVSTFNVTTAAIAAASNVRAVASDLDSDSSADDVTITWTASSAEGVVYDVYQDTNDNGSFLAADDTQVASNVSGTSVTALSQPTDADGYVYFVFAQDPSTGATSAVAMSNVVIVPASADTDGPESETTRLVTNAGFPADIDTGDVFRFTFDEDVVLTSNAAIRFTTTGPETWQLTNGVNATLSLNASSVTLTGSDAGTYAANRVLTVTVTGNPTPLGATVAADLPAPYALTVTAAAGITDAAGNVWDIAGSNVTAVQEVQTVTISGAPTGGTFALTFDGQTTTPLAYNITAGALETALEALSNIADVTVTGTYSVTFVDPAGDVAQMTADGSLLTGGTAPDVAVTTATPGVTGVNGTIVSN